MQDFQKAATLKFTPPTRTDALFRPPLPCWRLCSSHLPQQIANVAQTAGATAYRREGLSLARALLRPVWLGGGVPWKLQDW